MLFILSNKLFSFKDIHIFVIFFPSFSHFLDAKGQLKEEKFKMSGIVFHKSADVIFGITQTILYYIIKRGQGTYH